MTDPLITIVMPVWNGENFLNDAVQSVLEQSYRKIELIIVDDASTDSTPEILRNFASQDPRITVITNKSNLRLPASLNVGFLQAKGEWLTWTSDDNILENNCIDLLISNALTEKKKFVFCDYKSIDEYNNLLRINHTGPGELIYLENTVGACFLYNREVADVVGGYSEDKFMFEDYDYWVRAKQAGFELHHIDEINPYRYRIHEGQLSQKRKLPKNFIKYRFNLIKELDNERIQSRAYLSVLHLALIHKHFSIALRAGFKLFWLNPILGVTSIQQALRRRSS